MQNDPINTAPIEQFIQQVKGAENSKAREVKLDINQAKNLAFTLGIVMTRLSGNLEELITSNARGDNEVIEVKMDQGNW
jgi:hypothetical protein